jgi:thiamine monophosphate kinase
MRMKDVGEKGFLGSLLPTLPTDPRLIGGFGHDAAEIELPGGTMNLVLKIDRAPRPLAVAHQWANHACWGRMAVTAACSDILAFGGSPMALMLALSLSSETPTETARFIINGAVDECKLNNVIYAGGDTKEGSEINVVASAVGLVPKHLSLRRAVAEPGDLIVCAGEIGGFAASYFLASSPEYVDDMVHSKLSDTFRTLAPGGMKRWKSIASSWQKEGLTAQMVFTTYCGLFLMTSLRCFFTSTDYHFTL